MARRTRIERIAPVLTVDDLATAITEHTGVLGMRVVMDLGWVAFLADDDDRQIGLMTTDATALANPDVSVFVDDVDAARAIDVVPLGSERQVEEYVTAQGIEPYRLGNLVAHGGDPRLIALHCPPVQA